MPALDLTQAGPQWDKRRKQIVDSLASLTGGLYANPAEAPEDIGRLLSLLGYPEQAKEAAAGGAMVQPGYMASARYLPGNKVLKIDTFEAEKPGDILKLLKEVAGLVKKHDIKEVIGGSPLRSNAQGGTPMEQILVGAGGKYRAGDVHIPGERLVELASDKNKIKQTLQEIRQTTSPSGEEYHRMPITPLDRRSQIFSYYSPGYLKHSIPKQVERDIARYEQAGRRETPDLDWLEMAQEPSGQYRAAAEQGAQVQQATRLFDTANAHDNIRTRFREYQSDPSQTLNDLTNAWTDMVFSHDPQTRSLVERYTASNDYSDRRALVNHVMETLRQAGMPSEYADMGTALGVLHRILQE